MNNRGEVVGDVRTVFERRNDATIYIPIFEVCLVKNMEVIVTTTTSDPKIG